MNRARMISLLMALSWGVVAIGGIGSAWGYKSASVYYMLLHPALYVPQECRADPCTLTGLGGFVRLWDDWMDKNIALGHSFVVRGTCASACEREYRRAKAFGAEVTVMADAKLIYHAPQRAVWF